MKIKNTVFALLTAMTLALSLSPSAYAKSKKHKRKKPKATVTAKTTKDEKKTKEKEETAPAKPAIEEQLKGGWTMDKGSASESELAPTMVFYVDKNLNVVVVPNELGTKLEDKTLELAQKIAAEFNVEIDPGMVKTPEGQTTDYSSETRLGRIVVKDGQVTVNSESNDGSLIETAKIKIISEEPLKLEITLTNLTDDSGAKVNDISAKYSKANDEDYVAVVAQEYANSIRQMLEKLLGGPLTAVPAEVTEAGSDSVPQERKNDAITVTTPESKDGGAAGADK